MKKLLAMAMAVAMLCTSVCVLAAEEETELLRSYSYGFEDSEPNRLAGAGGSGTSTYSLVGAETYGADTLEDTSDDFTVTPHSGEKMMKVVNTSGENNMPFYNDACVDLEPNSKYRISFWYYSPFEDLSPFIRIEANGNVINNTLRNILGTAPAKTWTKFEFDFVTDNPVEEKLSFTFRAKGEKTEYYDDFCAEKVEMGSISFWSASTVNTMANTNRLVNTNTSNFGRLRAQLNYQMTVGEAAKEVWVYPDWVRGQEATAFAGTVNVVSHYVPKTAGEKVTLIATIMKDDASGKPQLRDVVLTNYEYGVEDITPAEGKTWYTAHTRFKGGLNTLTLNADSYEAGCYVKAYLWSSAKGLVPVSGTAVLGK